MARGLGPVQQFILDALEDAPEYIDYKMLAAAYTTGDTNVSKFDDPAAIRSIIKAMTRLKKRGYVQVHHTSWGSAFELVRSVPAIGAIPNFNQFGSAVERFVCAYILYADDPVVRDHLAIAYASWAADPTPIVTTKSEGWVEWRNSIDFENGACWANSHSAYNVVCRVVRRLISKGVLLEERAIVRGRRRRVLVFGAAARVAAA